MQRRPGSDEATRARLFGKRVGLLVCSAVALWFIAASVAQIIPAVFGAAPAPLPPATPGSPDALCAEALRRAGGLSTAPASARAETASETEVGLASCNGSPAGLDALAALRRLQMAEDHVGAGDPKSIETLRNELSAHLPGRMR